MASFRVVTSLVSYTPTATSENATYPATNLNLYGHLFRPWKASVQSAVVDVTLDFGSGSTLAGLATNPGILFDDCNITSATIGGNTVTTSWGAPPWNQAISFNQELWVRRRKGFFRLAALSASVFSYQYLNLRIPAQAGTDAGVYRIGRIAVGPITELLADPLYNIVRRVVDPLVTTEFLDGGHEVIELGNRRYEMEAERETVGSAELAEELAIQAVTRGASFLLWDAQLGGTEHAWMFRRTEHPSVTESFLEFYRGRWVFREII